MQNTCSGRRKQPIAYYSTELDSVAQGYPPCYQGVAALQYAYDKASTITLGYQVTLLTHLLLTKFVLTNSRTSEYMTLLNYSDVSINDVI
jgi:hypothetical protein